MNFCYEKFTKEMFNNMVTQDAELADGGYNGAIFVGDIAVDVVTRDHEGDGNIVCDLDFYVAHEDTGYGYTGKNRIIPGLPYDYAEGTCIRNFNELSYEEFVQAAEKKIAEYIKTNDKRHGYSLMEHACRTVEIW